MPSTLRPTDRSTREADELWGRVVDKEEEDDDDEEDGI